MSPNVIILLVVVAVLLFSMLLVVLSRYRRCPSDKIMVIYGKVGTNKDGSSPFCARCIHGGAAFVWPVVQAYEYLDLTPMSINGGPGKRPVPSEHPYRRPLPVSRWASPPNPASCKTPPNACWA